MNTAPGKRSGLVAKQLPVLLLVGLLSACAGSPDAQDDPAQPPKGGCYRSEWQAETVPVISKRVGRKGWKSTTKSTSARRPAALDRAAGNLQAGLWSWRRAVCCPSR